MLQKRYCRVNVMGVFRYENKYAAPTKEQRERYMKGDCEEHLFGPDDQILLVIYDEAVYLKNDIEGVRILFTGPASREKANDEVCRLIEFYRQSEVQDSPFTTGSKY